ncbi:helix-turn-helix transcriptional regulator [Salinicola avicenniae]|uniref:helix-turn-helix transcriptional regulator n=1 Tax=Salinicola avicenniae TaxID=2916836 RepID=UPI0035B544BC
MQEQSTEKAPLRFLKARDVCDKIAVSRSRLYELMTEDPEFPRPFKDGESRQALNYWVEHELEAWMLRRINRARSG